MTQTARRSLITLGILGAFTLGVWAAPHLRDTADEVNEPVMTRAAAEPDSTAPAAAPRARMDATEAETPRTMRTESVAADAEPVRKHARSLLSSGADPAKAAAGFNSAEQFLSVAYAAHATEVPFVLLKHRVLNENKSLEDAIATSKPDLDASLEAERARLNARAELQRLTAGVN